MNVLICSSNRYWRQVSVTAVSVAINHPNIQIHLYILFNETVTAADIRWMKEMLLPYNIVTSFIHFDVSKYEFDLGEKWPSIILGRLFAFDFLPKSVDRVLSLGADILVNKSISDFYSMDLEGNYFAGAMDVMTGYKCHLYKMIGLPEDSPYINADVLLHNIKKIREDFSFEKFVNRITNNLSQFEYADQDAINVNFNNYIISIDAKKYNCIVSAYPWTEEKELLQNTAIFHFASDPIRPWKYSYRKHLNSAISGDIWWKCAIKGGYSIWEYIRWKILNTILVQPWILIYKLYIRIIGKQ